MGTSASKLGSMCTRFGSSYASFSTRRPHITAASTAAGIIGAADLTCQACLQRDDEHGIDWQRTLGLTVFACWHYGVPAKGLYLWYDRFFGVAPTLSTAAKKMCFDVYVHSPLLLVPSFYMITGAVKGESTSQISAQLRDEWFTASFGTAIFWTPLCLLNFHFVPQHSRILVVSVGSYLHKTWLSWLSNRQRHWELVQQTAPQHNTQDNARGWVLDHNIGNPSVLLDRAVALVPEVATG